MTRLTTLGATALLIAALSAGCAGDDAPDTGDAGSPDGTSDPTVLNDETESDSSDSTATTVSP